MKATLDLATITLEQFQPLLNTDFHMTELKVTARLIEANPLRQSGGPQRRSPFRLLFVTGSMPDPLVHQGIMRLEHQELDALELFLVAVGQREQGLLYEAIFN
jgi:hypothetical protein